MPSLSAAGRRPFSPPTSPEKCLDSGIAIFPGERYVEGMIHPRQEAVLLVDDNDDLRGALAQLLSLDGYRVREARNGAHALRVLEEDGVRPFAIVLDLSMPAIDGWEFRRALAQIPSCSDVPVVVISAVDEDIARRAGLSGAVEYLRKPFDIGRLLGVLARLHPHDA